MPKPIENINSNKKGLKLPPPDPKSIHVKLRKSFLPDTFGRQPHEGKPEKK